MANRWTSWARRLTPSDDSALGRLKTRTDTLEDSLRGGLYRWRLPVFVLVVTVLAFAGRTALWPVVSADYNECLHPWLDEIRAGHGFHTIGTQIGNYTAPYHYLMAAMTYVPGLSNLAVIKLTSTLADFCLAGAAAALCWQLCRQAFKAAACYAVVLCLPTVFLNSAAWGQCDAMYATFVLLFAALLLAQHGGAAMFFYGCALAIKLQAIFVLPAVLILWLCGKLRLRQLLAGALAYVLLFVPAIMGDGSLAPMFRAYAMQTKIHSLSSNIANGASLFTGFAGEELGMLSGMLMAAFVVALGVLALYCWQRQAALNGRCQFLLVVLCAVLAPFLLPAMKDRYYYLAEVLCVVLAFAWPRRLWLPLAMQWASLPAYLWYLTGAENPFGRWLVLGVAAVAVAVFDEMRRCLGASPPGGPLTADGGNGAPGVLPKTS